MISGEDPGPFFKDNLNNATIFHPSLLLNQTLPTFAGIFEQRLKILETKWQNANRIRLT
jgi:hypothetical protein